MAHPKEQLVRSYLEAGLKSDLEAMGGLITDDVVHHVPGRNQLAGEYHGKAEFTAYAKRLFDTTGGTFKLREIHDVLANDDHGIALVRAEAWRGDRHHEWASVLTFHFRDGKICRVAVCPGDQIALDEFFAPRLDY